jgi:hypothetical protein
MSRAYSLATSLVTASGSQKAMQFAVSSPFRLKRAAFFRSTNKVFAHKKMCPPDHCLEEILKSIGTAILNSLFIDVINVILIRNEDQNHVVCSQVFELLELLLQEGVPVYAVSVVSEDRWSSLAQEFPFLKSHFQDVMFLKCALDDAKTRVQEVKDFLERQDVREGNTLYVYDSSVLTEKVREEFYASFRENSEIRPNFYNNQEVTAHWLKIRLVAEKVLYQSARSTEILLSENERELCGMLVRYLALAMCRQLFEWDLEDLIEIHPKKAQTHKWDSDAQHDGIRGAMMNTEGVTAYELVITCLEQFDLVERSGGRIYEMMENAQDIPHIIRTRRDINQDQFGWAVESFFDYEVQSSWSCTEEFPERMVKISTDVIDGFQANELIEEKDGKLVWSDKMDPYFLMTRRGGPFTPYSDHEEPRKEEASEFFARICKLTDGPLH